MIQSEWKYLSQYRKPRKQDKRSHVKDIVLGVLDQSFALKYSLDQPKA